jgi:hypothetical protein
VKSAVTTVMKRLTSWKGLMWTFLEGKMISTSAMGVSPNTFGWGGAAVGFGLAGWLVGCKEAAGCVVTREACFSSVSSFGPIWLTDPTRPAHLHVDVARVENVLGVLALGLGGGALVGAPAVWTRF